jgi:hypothetical protein
VIGDEPPEACRWERPRSILPPSTPHHHTGAASATDYDRTEPPMIRHQVIAAIQADESDLEDRSMRLTEYAIAFVALAVAGILALVR